MKNKYEIRGDTVVIFLHRKKTGETFETVIDAEDFEKVNSLNYTWFTEYCVDNGQYYARCNTCVNGVQITVKLHRFIMDCPKGLQVDHINHDTLDNRKSNLRIVTHAQNHQNKKGVRHDSRSGVKWVGWSNRDKNYRVSFIKEKKRYYFGSYKTIEEASEVAQRLDILRKLGEI